MDFEEPGLPEETTIVETVAHDLNNLLTIMSGWAEVLHARNQESFEARAVFHAAERARVLTRRLLRGREHPISLDVAKVVSELRDSLARLMPLNASFYVDIEPVRRSVRGRREELEQVVFNLCFNAVEALRGQRGKVAVNVRQIRWDGRDWVMLRVADSGPGIDRNLLTRVFENGFSTKGTTGLGLVLVTEAVKALNGRIGVKSSPDGTRFTIILPLEPDSCLE